VIKLLFKHLSTVTTAASFPSSGAKLMKVLTLLMIPMLLAGNVHAAKVLEYRFHDPSATQAIDTSGNALHGTFVGDIHVAPTSRGNAIAMDGNGDFFYLTDQPILDLNAHTIMAWVYWTQSPDPEEIRTEIMEKGAAYWSNIQKNGKLSGRIFWARLRCFCKVSNS
jgi:hypothetical protein